MSTELDITTILTVQPEQQEELQKALLHYADQLKTQEGYLAFHIGYDKSQPPRFILNERWQDHAAFLQHEKSDVFQDFASLFKKLLDKPLLSVFSVPLIDG
ncbi:MAG: antibiotic biosynthesis monooxygenase family protein [Zymomonas mobilis]|uniref:Quinol monooxygenase YgiN n=1 Tax=Zymomonas mobilis TaxID=542 RepID=A0A542W1S8_ZYMMB|nr:antibiotic biosynthesis monooxygenase family protein [Zymomonas mobilis]TQL17545.1 quinol monooxygenase YgiN [Zymomonas mobilis]